MARSLSANQLSNHNICILLVAVNHDALQFEELLFLKRYSCSSDFKYHILPLDGAQKARRYTPTPIKVSATTFRITLSAKDDGSRSPRVFAFSRSDPCGQSLPHGPQLCNLVKWVGLFGQSGAILCALAERCYRSKPPLLAFFAFLAAIFFDFSSK